MTDKFPEDLEEKLRKIFNEPDILNKFKDLEKMSFLDQLITIFKLILPIIQDKDKLIIFLETIPDLITNLDELALMDKQYDSELYLQIRNTLETAFKTDESKTNNIIKAYLQSFETKYPFDRFIYTIQLMHDFIPELIELLKSTPVNELADIFYKRLFKMIEENQKEQFDYYFFDWTLKFGYLIEAYYKEFLITFKKLDYFLNGKSFGNMPKVELTVGRLLNYFKASSNLGIIRNAIFHSDFTIDYQLKIEEREIIFKDRKNREEKFDIETFSGTFFEVFQVINTSRLAFSFFLIKKNKNHIKQVFTPIIQKAKAELEKTKFQKITINDDSFKELKNDLEKTLQNMAKKGLIR